MEEKMKKLILATIACAFIAGPALATDFAAEQAKTLGNVISKMEQVKNDPAHMDALTAQRNCVEKATKIEDLQKCMDKMQGEKKEAAKK
jgi:Ni/Co efflux regulator RcnB